MTSEVARESLRDFFLPITISLQKPWVQLIVNNKQIGFLIDKGVTYSMLNTKLTKKCSAAVIVTGLTGH